jgi:hypothetical protein
MSICQTVVDFSGVFALSDWLMLLSQHTLALRLLFPSFPADSADSKQLESNQLESIEIESIAQIPTLVHSFSQQAINKKQVNRVCSSCSSQQFLSGLVWQVDS